MRRPQFHASKCEIRGTLVRDNGQAHAAASISRLTRLPQTIIQEAIDRLISEDIGWMEVIDNKGDVQISQEGAVISHPTDYGTEGNGTEENGKEKNNNVADAPDSKNIFATQFKNLYNERCADLPKCTKLTDMRRKHINARVADYGEDEMRQVIDLVVESDFLSGRSGGGWKANFDWIINPNNCAKILEGNYGNKKPMQTQVRGL